MKKLFTSKYSSIALVAVIAILFLASSSFAFAAAPGAGAAPTSPPSSFSCSIFSLPTCAVNFVAYFISKVFDLLIFIGGWLTEQALVLSNGVFNLSAVQNGFGKMLSLANLGFVLAIIVIAIATILRSETYGYKKALWRLVAMAILINFGLVITAPIIGFANGMTTYFEKSIQNGTASFTDQIGTKLNIGIAATPPTLPKSTDTDPDSFLKTLMQLVFVIIFKFFIALALLAIGILLLVRFFWLAILLILLPAAWLTWVFPNLSGQFSAWWQKFIHWTFFAPAAMFFIWLSLNIQQNFADVPAGGNSNTAAAALSTYLGLPGVVNQLINNIVVIGILVGGLMAASKLAGGAGTFAVTQAKNVSNAVQGFVGKQGKKAARATYQKAGADKWLTQRMQTSRIPGVSMVGRGLATVTEKAGKKLVDEASKEAAGKSSDRLAIELKGMGGILGKEKQFAYLAELQKRADLDKVTTISGKNLGQFIDANKDKFDQYEQGKLKSDINKSIGSDEEMRKAAEDFASGVAGAGAILNTATEKFNKNLSASDVQKGQMESMFLDPAYAAANGKSFGLSAGAYEAVQNEHVYSMGKHASTQTLSSFHGKLAKGGQQAQFDAAMKAKVATLRAGFGIPAGIALSPAQKTIIMNALFSSSNKKWIESNAAQNMGIDPANWGIA